MTNSAGPDASTPTATGAEAAAAPEWLGDPALLAAFWRYERALMTNDVPELDELFARGLETIRSEAGSALVGHDAIAAFRAARPPVPRRSLRRVHLRPVAEDAVVVVAESVRADRGTGTQTQLWQRIDGLWAVTVAHVSTVPGMQFSGLKLTTAEERAIWATPEDRRPLVASMAYPDGDDRVGALAGIRVAVKDLFAIAGETIGAGNPAFRAGRTPERFTAPAVLALLRQGAEITGLAQTDELAFSIAGTNVHYGTPPNPAAPGHISGGSTSGPASAVALGLADLALGTDTAGSIRVPGSYTGLYGLRTTHDAVSREGLVPLAPSFDTVGLLGRDLATLATGARALLTTGPARASRSEPITRIVVDPALVALADASSQLSFRAAVRALGLNSGADVVQSAGPEAIDPDALERWFEAFRTAQQFEAWQSDRTFVEANPGALEAAIAERFRVASTLTEQQVLDARSVLARATTSLEALIPAGSALALPATAGPAPALDATAEEIDRVRGATLRLTCLASFSGMSALTLPYGRVGTLPVGLCVIGARGADLALLDLASSRA
ncbi:amidase [Subtercola sp. Z020]|uniref:AtzH-like domain-containing protein n=1 Tax=Subtercola sp. Z020 TaxID=2080582 RepID=UPI000CE7C657|nr:AtzH-like domain-containing protein [Subtercola sp. Z020]PPF82243.1 amidase [Subtercola sp. Z020]